MPENPQIDLLVATIHRKSELSRLLESLRWQTYRNFRVLLADQNPPDYLQSLLASFFDLPIEHFSISSKGVSEARNSLLPYIRGDIVAFPDDDCWYAQDALENVVRTFSQHPEAGIVLGAWGPHEPVKEVAEGWQSTVQLFKRAGTHVQFYRKESIKKLQFDSTLGPGTGLPFGCGEDTDFLLRASARARIWRENAVHVFHAEPVQREIDTEKVSAYASGRMYLLHKHHLPLWFVFANIVYPLLILPLDIIRHGRQGIRYRWAMFMGRLRAWRGLLLTKPASVQ